MFEPGGPSQLITLPPPPPERRGRIIALAAAGVVVALFGVYSILVFAFGDRVPRGTTVAGVPLGGLSRSAAEARLRDQLLPEADKPLKVTAGGQTYTLDPADVGLALDLQATTDAAYVPRTFNPVRLARALGGGDETPPVLTVDQSQLGKAMKSLAAKVDKPASEGGITFAGGTPKATTPKAGQQLDQKAAGLRLQQEFLVTRGPIALPAAERKPSVSAAEVQKALQDFATPAMSGPVTVRVGDKSFDATPEEIGSALKMVGKGGALAPKLDGKALEKNVAKKLKDVQTEPVDATVKISGGKPTIVPSKQGHTVPPDRLASAVLAALPKSGGERVAQVQTVTTDPKVTTKLLQGFGIKEVVGEFTTYYPHASYRNTNIGRAAELINGALIKPGETFSLNGLVGERTAENGFTEGFVIKGGRLREELGGGVSQVATTTYNAGFFAGMEDVEHRPHGFYIPRYPVGREATVYWGSLDLRWRNNTPYGVYIEAKRTLSTPGSQGRIRVRLWSTKYWEVKTKTTDRYNIRPPKTLYDEKPGCVDQPDGAAGFDVDVHRWIYLDGKLAKSETDHVKYNPEDKIVCGPAPDNKPPDKQQNRGLTPHPVAQD
ncbi:VanW family protein [Actinopolymorpha alba]|uniref:VanW family protein n=1 Tax=Actinopolymorpha alba TaxID=533267 RepID=UPI0003746428|nr:VanW family protein [Actinopolymorpha alba]